MPLIMIMLLWLIVSFLSPPWGERLHIKKINSNNISSSYTNTNTVATSLIMTEISNLNVLQLIYMDNIKLSTSSPDKPNGL